MTALFWKECSFLLRREFLFQLEGRSTYARAVYPGINWFALICIGALLLEFNASRLSPGNSNTAIDHFLILALAQGLLVALRSTVYCALSFSRDLQNHTITVVRMSPIRPSVALGCKLVACLAPLWLELIIFLPISFTFFSIYLSLPPVIVVALVPFLICLSLISGCLGLLIGSTTSSPQQAVRHARTCALLLLLLIPALKTISEGWWIPLIGLWLWLLSAIRRSPHRRLIFTVFAGLSLALIFINTHGLLGLSLANLHPIEAINAFYGGMLRSWHLPLGPWASQLLSTHLATAATYLVVSFSFFQVARARYDLAR